MSAAERLAAAMSKLDAATREQQEQRGLRERHVAEAQAKATETVTKEAAVHGRYITHMQELAKRHKEAGGWLTEKALADRTHTMGFSVEDDDKPADEFGKFGGRPVPPSVPAPPPVPMDLPPAAVVPPAGPPVPEAAPVEPAAPRRRGRHARDSGFDDDDFSNNSWMVD
jgi:hypothetical protein